MRLLSGESGKCWSHQVRAHIDIARSAEYIIVFRKFVVSSFVRMLPMIKQVIHTHHVIIARVPEKNP